MAKSIRITALLLFYILISTGCTKKPVSDKEFELYNTFVLLKASADAAQAGRTEDAAFLLLAGRARYEIDSQVYPPTKSGGSGPGVLVSALVATVGQGLSPALQADPNASANAAARLAKWTPQFPAGYDPGWEYQNSLQGKAAAAIVATVKAEIKGAVDAQAILLANPDYMRAKEEFATAAAAENKLGTGTFKDGRYQPLSEVLQREREQVIEKKNVAATRMREIEWKLNPETRWHAKVGWKAKDYFDDEQVIALCQAIEADDVPEMKRLIAAGADVNAVGKEGMTLLLWAFPDRKIERFKCLLEAGANPNVFVESDFGTKGKPFHPYPAGGQLLWDLGCKPGNSVTHLACRSPVIEYCDSVMNHGGDPNLEDKKTGQTPLDIAVDRHTPDMERRVPLLLSKGADPNRYCEYELAFPLVQSIQDDRYDIALLLLNGGADPNIQQPKSQWKAIHFLALKDGRVPSSDTKRMADYQALVQELVSRGDPIDKAREEMEEMQSR
jgi:uncharacterized protein